MAKKKVSKIVCTIELTEGARQRLTEAMCDLYYAIKDGRYEGPPLLETNKEDKPA